MSFLFKKKKSDAETTLEIDKLLKKLPLPTQLSILGLLATKYVSKNIRNPVSQMLLDAMILEILKRQYIPKGVLLHLSLIAEKLVQENPNLINEIQNISYKEIENGVV